MSDGIVFDRGVVVVAEHCNSYPVCVKITDDESESVLGRVKIPKPGIWRVFQSQWYRPLRVEIKDEAGNVLHSANTVNIRNKEILVRLPPRSAVGDSLAWFPAAARFQEKHGCKLSVYSPRWFIDLVKDQYRHIRFIDSDSKDNNPDLLKFHAVYDLGLFPLEDNSTEHTSIQHPVDFRLIGLHDSASGILGLPYEDTKVKLNLSAPRTIEEKYVCIAVHGSSKTKCWNNPKGWLEVIKFLKKNGYRVLCIDKEQVIYDGLLQNSIPNGAEDFTGDIPLQERINLIKDADFFIGLSSGLSWLAYSCNVPVVLISGFTLPFNEFETPYRVINYNGCTGCWNDTREKFDHHDFQWCPRRKGTDRQFECSRIITAAQVIKTIKRIPTFTAASEADEPEAVASNHDIKTIGAVQVHGTEQRPRMQQDVTYRAPLESTINITV